MECSTNASHLQWILAKAEPSSFLGEKNEVVRPVRCNLSSRHSPKAAFMRGDVTCCPEQLGGSEDFLCLSASGWSQGSSAV